MLTAVVLHLRPVAEARLPKSHGSFAYRAAQDSLVSLCPPLGPILHKGERHKPLTCSLLTGTDQPDRGDLILSPERVYTWRLTGLTPEVSQQLLRLSPSSGIRIDKAVFSIENVSTTPIEHPEAKQETYEALLTRWEKKGNLRKVTLHFLPPGATFRVGNSQQPFPLPYWVFRSLLSSWNAFAPPPFKDLETTLVNTVRERESIRFASASDANILNKILEEMVVLHNWRGETKHLQLGRYETSTFIGKFEYKIAKPFPELCQLLGLLSEFAFYAGVGWQTTHGLGQVRAEFPSHNPREAS